MKVVAALWLIGLFASAHADMHTIESRMVGVHDDDTTTLLDAANRQRKIRLDGIDAPELVQPFGRAWSPSLTPKTRAAVRLTGELSG